MKENYIISAFRETIKRDFAGRAQVLNEAFDGRLQSLRQENADATKEKQRHLEGQILPGIAAYETLQTVLPKEQALQTVHGYVEQHAQNFRRTLTKLLRLPGLYRLVPGIFASATKKHFGQSAGFAAKEYQTSGGVWRIDMTRCPYHDTCAKYGCPELCRCFCDSDDVSYENLDPQVVWQRTKSLGLGGDCCDFCFKIRGK